MGSKGRRTGEEGQADGAGGLVEAGRREARPVVEAAAGGGV